MLNKSIPLFRQWKILLVNKILSSYESANGINTIRSYRSENWLRQLKSQLVLIRIIGLGMLSTQQINLTVEAIDDSASKQNIIFITNQLTVLTKSGPIGLKTGFGK